jgi:hypothetical protein
MLSSDELPMDMHEDQICSSLADASRCLPENVQYLVKKIHSSPFVSFLMLGFEPPAKPRVVTAESTNKRSTCSYRVRAGTVERSNGHVDPIIRNAHGASVPFHLDVVVCSHPAYPIFQSPSGS